MSDCLSRILFPLDKVSFLNRYQTREYCHISRNSPGYYEDLLGGGDLDALLQSGQLPAAFVNVVKDGKRFPLEDWSRVDTSARGEHRVAVSERLFELYSEGATLVLNLAHRALPSFNSLCRNLTVDFGFPAQANIYITPRGIAGFSRHADDHEVLVLQIAGSKRWMLYVQDAPMVEIDLRPGDLLYLPRGLIHAARAQEDDSIHVTLGLYPVYAFQLIEELAALAGGEADFAQPAPPLFADDHAKRAFEAEFLRQLQSLILRTKPSDLMQRRSQALIGNQERGWPGRLSDLRLLSNMTLETIVCRRTGILTAVTDDGKFLSVEFAAKRVIVAGFLKGALDTIMSGSAFAIGDLEGLLGAPGKVKLVTEFVRAGLLRIVNL